MKDEIEKLKDVKPKRTAAEISEDKLKRYRDRMAKACGVIGRIKMYYENNRIEMPIDIKRSLDTEL